MSAGTEASTWTLLTGHGHVLVAIAKNPRARIRDLALDAGVTERTTQAIIADLEAAGYITRRRVGRRSEYTIHAGQAFRHQSQDGLLVGPFLELLAGSMPAGAVDDGFDEDDDGLDDDGLDEDGLGEDDSAGSAHEAVAVSPEARSTRGVGSRNPRGVGGTRTAANQGVGAGLLGG